MEILNDNLFLKTQHQPNPILNLKNQFPELHSWIQNTLELTQAQNIHLATGSETEYQHLCQLLVNQGTFIPLKKRPNSFLAWSDPQDVARVEDRTFICSLNPDDAGPTNNWKHPSEMKNTLNTLFSGSMRGRTLYVIPFCMGPIGSPLAQYGVQITDSPYVVVNMKIMTRMGEAALKKIIEQQDYIKCLHSVGRPLEPGEKDLTWPCNHKEKYIAHFPESQEIISFGSGYGGNALLGKKCLSLRIASVKGQKDGWLAEHMLIMGVKQPGQEKRYVAAAFPSACGKTNFAMMVPPNEYKDWEVSTIGDDIAWIKPDPTLGTLRAINPEAGFFGVAPGTSLKSNYNATKSIEKNTIFTNVALTDDGDVWWEGLTETPPEKLTDWQGQPWTPNCGRLAAHPNSRFTTPLTQCPSLDANWDHPEGVPISAFIFGGRRASLVPLVTESKDWSTGVFLASSIGSETTAAATGAVGVVRRDPFAMLPFCGYNMGDYFNHWLKMEESLGQKTKLPKIFLVNWFRKNEAGKFLWPGFGQNLRVLKWMLERIKEDDSTNGQSDSYKNSQSNRGAQTIPFGFIPTERDIDSNGLQLTTDFKTLFEISKEEWAEELGSLEKFYRSFGNRIPEKLLGVLQNLKEEFKRE